MALSLPIPTATNHLAAFDTMLALRECNLVEIDCIDDCPVCLGQHDEEIHLVTLGLRQWFRGEVTKSFAFWPVD